MALASVLLAGPGGIAQTPSGIYIVDRGNNRIVKINDMTGAGWTTFGTKGSGANQFDGPDGIFVDAGGRIYVADGGNHRIVRMDDMTGAGWVAFGTSGPGINQFSSPHGLFVDGGGRVYVADGGPPGGGNHRIVGFNDMTGAGWAALGRSQGYGVGEFDDPGGVWVDSAGRIYIADTINKRVVRVNDMSGAGWTSLGNIACFPNCAGVGLFYFPSAIVVDAAGRIYIADSANSRIVRMNDMRGAGWTTLGRDGRGPNQFNRPIGLAVDATGRFYVVDAGNGQIVRFDDFTGAGWVAFGANGRSGATQFSFLRHIAVR